MDMNNQVLRTLFAFFAALLFTAPLNAQQVKYWIRLKDKNGTPYSLTQPQKFLTQKSIDRRERHNISLHYSDLPVNPAYIQQIAGVQDVQVLYASKWLNGVVIAVPNSTLAAGALQTIGGFPFVEGNSKVNRYVLREKTPENITEKTAASHGVAEYGRSGGQIRQLGVNCLHEKGFRGQGLTIAVCDVGFDFVNTSILFDSLRNRGGILGTRDFVSGGTDAYQGGGHGTNVLSCMAAIQHGTVMGTAPMANYWLFRTEEGARETISEEYNWIRAAEFADSVGVDIITTSLGYTEFDDPAQDHTYQSLNGRTAPMSIASTMAARKGILVFTAAGNEGQGSWKYISVAGDADSVCTVGAVDTSGNRAGFSSIGPTSDGRIKPDLVACGWNTWICEGGGNVCYPGSGTSFATPVLAGAAACYWQMHKSYGRYYDNIKILGLMKKRASNSVAPDNLIGWGIPALCDFTADDSPIKEFDFTVYADRNTSVVTIRLSNTEHKDVKVELLDMRGRKIFFYSEPYFTSVLRFDVENLSDHIYIVKVTSAAGTKTRKLVR
jgi:serine protease AprX